MGSDATRLGNHLSAAEGAGGGLVGTSGGVLARPGGDVRTV